MKHNCTPPLQSLFKASKSNLNLKPELKGTSSSITCNEKWSLRASPRVDTAVIVQEDRPKSRFPPDFQVSEGYPVPFIVESTTLCLISLSHLPKNRVTHRISLDPLTNKTGYVWHVLIRGDFKDMLYGYQFYGSIALQEGHYYHPSRVVLDPYAKAVVSRGEFGVLGSDDNCWPKMVDMIPIDSCSFCQIYVS